MRRYLTLPLILSTLVSASEPSVFGAGDLNSPNPYGLTHEEKLILENKKELQAVVQKNNAQNSKVETVAERIEGMQGILEGLSQKTNENSLALQSLTDKYNTENNTSLTLDQIGKQVEANTENIAQFKALLEELSHAVDDINANYVTKEQFSVLIKQLKVSIPKTTPSTTAVSEKTDIGSIEQQAYQLISQNKYADAQTNFEKMVQKKYKVPEALYMIGETLFERKSYKEAVAYYKDSASRNQKAGYMPTLLLHSGISMEKSGDTATAKAFFQATVSKYGGSGAAKEAQEHLSKLK
jgi:TolA-binding protein